MNASSIISRVSTSTALLLGLVTVQACSGGSSDDAGTFGTFDTGDGDGDSDTSGDGDTGTGDGDGDGDTGGESCGDGVVDSGEECDMGDENAADAGCTPECTIATCGDGFTYSEFEECDDGNQDDTDECVDGCIAATCGDGFVQAGVEECDDGNDDEADGCNSMCLPGTCGDGIVQEGEQCDDGNADTTDECPACQLAYCGDGYAQADQEECDDGNELDTDGCLTTFCTLATCGDGHLYEGVETCDDANDVDTDECPTSCMPATCGDGFVWADNEDCDDANDIDDDQCANDCTKSFATCADITTNMQMWGLTGNGVDLRAYTDSQLHYIGCVGNGCTTDSFYCMDDPLAHTLQFGTNATSALRSAVDPGDALGDTMPVSFNSCCTTPNGLCNAPNTANNNVNIDMVQALCAGLGYNNGTVVREVNSNSCPEPHAVSQDGLQWGSDFASSSGFGAEYLCFD